jgi:signal peptidase II
MFTGLFKRPALGTVSVIFSLICLDQATKLIAKIYLQPIHSVKIIGNFLRFTYVENPGMAFGIQLSNKVFFNVLSIIAVIVIFIYLLKLRDHNLLRFSFSIILGGAFGNLIDRFFYGQVVDFIDVEFFNIHFKGGNFLFWDLPPYAMDRWPVFNIADSAVSIVMILIILIAIFERKPHPAIDDAASEDI